jgi:hypothetical protein
MDVRFPMSAAVKSAHLNVTITGVNVQRMRTRLGLALLQLAARVIGVGAIHVDLETKKPALSTPATPTTGPRNRTR